MNLPAQQLLHEEQRLIIQTLTLSNFKGIKLFTLDAQGGQDLNVYGDNATGKTTLYDAFLWLLFDKDSSNRKSFQVKTLDATGEALHGLEHTVEASLLINGRPVTLRKTLTEKWTKKRGEAQKVFTGHQTEFWINEVPAKAGEYSKYIDSLISEDLFRLITNPMYFSTMLSWQDRRNILIQITGNISDADVIASNAALHELTAILGDRSVDDCRKIIAGQIKKLNEELAKVPVRIDELNNSLPSSGDINYSVIEADLTKAKAELQELEKQMLSATAVTESFRAKQNELTKLYSELGQKRSEIERQANAERLDLQRELGNLQSKLGSTKVEIQVLESKIKVATDLVKNARDKADLLRVEWGEVNGAIFTPPAGDDVICPTCGQDLPNDQLEAKIGAMLDKFNTQKKQRLDQISAEGKKLMGSATDTEKHIANMAETLDTKQREAIILENDIGAIQTVLELPAQTVDIEADPEYQAIQAKILALQADNHPAEDTSSAILAQKQELTRDIEQMNAILNNREVRTKTLARIEELKMEERRLANQIAELEKHRWLTEEFIKTKVRLMEDAINSRFKMVTFKLFDTQINEGIKECCEAMVNGVPYADANNAAKINAGLDIINTLSTHYGVSAPIFIDNREAVVELFPVNAQTISLVVSGQDKTLRVEV